MSYNVIIRRKALKEIEPFQVKQLSKSVKPLMPYLRIQDPKDVKSLKVKKNTFGASG